MRTKACTTCRQEKPAVDFYMTRHGTPDAKCKCCRLEIAKQKYARKKQRRATIVQHTGVGGNPCETAAILSTWS